MRGKIVGGIASFAITGALWLARGTIEAWFFDRVLKMVQPHWSWVVEYLPPAIFAALTIWLLYTGTRRPDDGVRLALSKLRARGVPIRNEVQPSMTDAELEAWIASTRSWMREVTSELSKISQEDAEWFLTLDAVPNPRVQIPNIRLGGNAQRSAFVSNFCQHDYRLSRLERLLQKYGVGAAIAS